MIWIPGGSTAAPPDQPDSAKSSIPALRNSRLLSPLGAGATGIESGQEKLIRKKNFAGYSFEPHFAPYMVRAFANAKLPLP